MRPALAALIAALFLGAAGVSGGAEKGAKKDDPAHVRKDIADHRAMAEAHLNAAKCLEAGRPEKECHAQLAKDCKGLAIGKYCGLKHRH
ncbi:MAG TPA: hypothetical protein VNK67_11775 [Burkholderiales bacterium]|nr:hypothetical protein [Burkholderiales bacterium]